MKPPILLSKYVIKHKQLYTGNSLRTWNKFEGTLAKLPPFTTLLTYGQFLDLKKYFIAEGYAINTCVNFIDKFKALIRAAGRDGYKISTDLHLMIMQGEDSHAIYLDMDEIIRIQKIELYGSMDAIRDRFIIGCLTGLRFSDYRRLSKQHVQKGCFVITTLKTKTKVVIPIHPIVAVILKKYNGDLPHAYSNWYFNKYLPSIGAKARINEKIMIERQLKGVIVQEAYLKHELITTHTARRSAATNMYLAGIPTFRIMLITGHATEAAFFKYIRITRQENAYKLSHHPFFSQ